MLTVDSAPQAVGVRMAHTSMLEFVRQVKHIAADTASLQEQDLMREWRTSSEYLHDLNQAEAGAADGQELIKLPPELVARSESLLQDPSISRTLGIFPCSWALIDLTRAIPWQHYVNTTFAVELASSIPASPSVEQLYDFVTNNDRDVPRMNVTPGRTGNSFDVSSLSNDLRVLDTVSLKAESVTGYTPYGRPCAVVAVFLGYSFNVMTAIHLRGRLMLLNGTHHAYALASRGIKRAPCVVRHVNSIEDLRLTVPPREQLNEGFFSMSRPPLLRDFDDLRLARRVAATRNLSIIHMDMTFTRATVPAPF